MQSQLKNLMEGDTPRMLGSPTNLSLHGFSTPKAWACASSSPKARAATARPQELPKPGPEYTGPRLEPPDSPIELDFAMALVQHFQHHRKVPLPARYLCRLLDEAERVLETRDKDGPVQELRLSQASASNGTLRPPATGPEPQMILVGDLHGQLADCLWIFYKLGVPSPTNRYLFNGDICDRGEHAVEIWALLFVFMAVWPESVYAHRGNHEDRLLNMDFNCGGFYDEVLNKYGRFGNGPMIYEKFARIFAKLPLASAIDGQVFVVHGGLSRGPPGSFLRLLRQNRSRAPEVPAASAAASAADLAFVDAMWADPQDHPGSSPNPRGPGLSSFGPDVTEKFLKETGYALVVRSHQVPPNNDGFFVHHNGKLLTVFSASNYCGLSGNQGAVLVLKGDSSVEAVRHWAPPFDRLAEVLIEAPEVAADATPASIRKSRQMKRTATAGALETQVQAQASGQERAQRLHKEVLSGAARLVVERKAELFSFWEQCDSIPPRGFINKHDWEEGMKAILGDSLPWKAIGKVLRVKDTITKDVDYRAFLGRFRVCVVGHGPAGGERWSEELLGRFYGRLLALRGDAGSLEELEGFLGGEDGQVSSDDALEAFRWVLGNYITEDQSRSLLRTLAAHSLPELSTSGRPLGVFEFLARLDICFQHQAGMTQNSTSSLAARQSTASPWAKSVLSHLGRLLWTEDSGGSPKAGSSRMLEVFRYFDEDKDGLLQRAEFSEAVKRLLAEYARDLPEPLAAGTASDEHVAELVDCVDISGDGHVNYLEFLHAFQPVDRTPGGGLRTDLMEQICTTIWTNKASLLRTFQVLEEADCEASMQAPAGRVSQGNLRRTVRSLNASLEAARGGTHGAPLTADQIDILVDHAVFDDSATLDYQAWLNSFQVIDMSASTEPQSETVVAAGGAAGSRHT